MPRKQPATAWRKKALIEDLVTGLPFVACMLAGAFSSRYYFIAGLLFFAVGFTLQRIRFRRTRCQRCGLLLRRKPKNDSRVSFHCPSCDIIWQTGVVQDGEPAS